MTPNGIQRRDSAIRSTPDRSAYTLIELLIAAVLTATLMTVIWGLLSMYNAWLTAGRVQSEERQLRRSLMALLQDDLESVALLDSGRKVQFLESAADVIATDVEPVPEQSTEDPLALAMEPELEAADLPAWLQSLGLPNQSRGVPELSLTGTSTLLRLVVPAAVAAEPDYGMSPEPVPAGGPETPAGPSDSLLTESGTAAILAAGNESAPESAGPPATASTPPLVRVIVWQFRPWGSASSPAVSDPADPQSVLPDTGLTRQVWDGTTLQQLVREQSSNSGQPGAELSVDFTAAEVPLVSPAPLDEERIPEATAVQFEYFDGRRWQSSWNSSAQGGLPVAVRLRMWMVSTAAAERLSAQVQQSTSVGGVLAADATSGVIAEASPAGMPSAESAVPMELLERTLILQPITGAMPGLTESADSLPGGLP